ncbi:MAG: hypothetical protein ACK557_22915 [Planctomycetota bacterium]
MKSSVGILPVIMLLAFYGCSPRTSVSTIRISDPDAGGAVDIPVQRNGDFSKKTTTSDCVAIASGTISDAQKGVSSVRLVYERTIKAGTGQSKTEKIETTFTAQPDVEVPIGLNPSKPTASGNGIARVTAQLLMGK